MNLEVELYQSLKDLETFIKEQLEESQEKEHALMRLRECAMWTFATIKEYHNKSGHHT